MKKKFKALLGVFACVMAIACMAVPVMAADGATVATADDFKTIMDSVTTQVNIANIVGIIASIIVVCIGLVFFWWGLRKVIKMLMGAFKKGKLSV